jgi:hypothetical protein
MPGFLSILGRALFPERAPYSFAICAVGANKDVEVFGGARLGVNANRISPDHKIPSAFRVQMCKKVLEVLIHGEARLSAYSLQSKARLPQRGVREPAAIANRRIRQPSLLRSW